MKDPNRIPIILELLEMYWEQNPNKSLYNILEELAEEQGHPIVGCNDELLRKTLFNKVTEKWTLR